MAGGRPTKYDAAIQAQAEAYVAGGWKDTGAIPSVAGLSIELRVTKSTVYLWAEKHEEFSDLLRNLNAVQEQVLLLNGLTGEYNAAITKLVLAKQGYSEKVETVTEHKITGFEIVSDES